MATALDVISRALRLIGVVDAGETVRADQSRDAIEALNRMLQRWQRDGIGIDYVPITGPTDTLTIQPEAVEAVTFNLAVTMSPEFGRDPPQLVMLRAKEGYLAVLRDSQGWPRVDLSGMPSTWVPFDINNG